MINRIIIRIKVLQVIYSYYQKESKDWSIAENELMFSIQKTYDLYLNLLWLISLLTDVEQKRLDLRKHKYLATDQELNPDTRFINNRLAAQLSNNKTLLAYINSKGSVWNKESNTFVRGLLDRIIDSPYYTEYLQSEDSYESDREFWRKIFKEMIFSDEDLQDLLEDESIFWNDDLEIVGTFVLKTIKRFDESNGNEQELLPMFKDEDDKDYAKELLKYTILEEKEYNRRITDQIKNWDIERIALMDLYIMQIALAELIKFPSIPVSVTLNEYIDIAKYYSTPKSGHFINGILDAIVGELKKENLLFKNG